LVKELLVLKERALVAIDNVLHSDEYDDDIKEKVQEAKGLMNESYGDVTKVSRDLVTFYMGISKLEEELNHEQQ
jgi:hypothetical protein